MAPALPENKKWKKVLLKTPDGTYSLQKVGKCAPALVISGVRMHLVKETTPYKQAEAMVEALGVRKGDHVLDICTGLGYTSIAAARRGAEVITIEKDENVLELLKINPWSQEFFRFPIEQIAGDALEELPNLGKFDGIIHDPPRFALAPELYSKAFYIELRKHAPRMVHYVGNPGAKYRRKSFLKGCLERLREGGWKPTYNKGLQSIICT